METLFRDYHPLNSARLYRWCGGTLRCANTTQIEDRCNDPRSSICRKHPVRPSRVIHSEWMRLWSTKLKPARTCTIVYSLARQKHTRMTTTPVNKTVHPFERSRLESLLFGRFFYAPAFDIYGGEPMVPHSACRYGRRERVLWWVGGRMVYGASGSNMWFYPTLCQASTNGFISLAFPEARCVWTPRSVQIVPPLFTSISWGCNRPSSR